MICFINEDLFKVIKKPKIEGFRKTQIRTIGTGEDNDKRVCSFLLDGENMNDHYVNIKTGLLNRQASVVIRSNERNSFDTAVCLIAIPFNGIMLKSKVENFRFRNAFIINVTDDVKASYPKVAEYEHIFYGIIEPNIVSLSQESHPRHTDCIRVSIITKVPGESTGLNHIIDFKKAGDNLTAEDTVKNWDVSKLRETEPGSMPFRVYVPPKAGSNQDRKKGGFKKPFNKKPYGNKPYNNNRQNNNGNYQRRNNYHSNNGENQQQNGERKPYNPNYRKPYNSNGNENSNRPYNKEPRKNYQHYSDDYGEVNEGKRSYPAKNKKYVNNRQNNTGGKQYNKNY